MCTSLRHLSLLASLKLHILSFEFWAYYILFIFDFKMDTPRWSGTLYVEQAVPKLNDPLASSLQILRILTCSTTPGF